jgi:hypothetical protein
VRLAYARVFTAGLDRVNSVLVDQVKS